MGPSKKTVVIFHNPEKAAARRGMPRLKAFFVKRGYRVVRAGRSRDAALGVALGGDGTLLAAARALAPKSVPVLGVNLGRLGFLTATDYKKLYPALERLLKGKMPLSNRMMLAVGTSRGKSHLALNDCVIRGSDTARAVWLSVRVNGKYLGTYVGDGLILSTPTGSTAYSLAASGPIAEPELDLILLTPICSHSLTQRPVILSPESEVEVRVEHHSQRDRVMMSLDGQMSFPMKVGDRVKARRAAQRFLLYRDEKRPYFSILRKKLKWGER